MVFTTGANAPNLINFVEYLESSGTQWFDTGFVPNPNTRVEIKVEVLSTTVARHAIFGARPVAGSVTDSFAVWNLDGILRWDYNDSFVFTATNAVGVHTIMANKNAMTVDGETVSITEGEFSPKYSLLIFCANNGGTADTRRMTGRLYYCQIYDNDVLIRDYWPCYDPNGVACLYDKVNRQYEYNAGTGEFIAGMAA